jgi:hypothetical protein
VKKLADPNSAMAFGFENEPQDDHKKNSRNDLLSKYLPKEPKIN